MTQSHEEIQEHVRKLGSNLMRDGLTEATVRQMGDFADSFAAVAKTERPALYAAAKVASPPKAKVENVVDHPAANGAIGPIKAKGAKSLGSQTESAPATCSCGGFVYNPTKLEAWGKKHEAKGEEHVVTYR